MPKKQFKLNVSKLNRFSPSDLVLNHLGKFHHHPFSSTNCKYRLLSASTSKSPGVLQVLPSKCPPTYCLLPPVYTTHDPGVSTVISCFLLDWSLSFHPCLISLVNFLLRSQGKYKSKSFYSVNQSQALLYSKPPPVMPSLTMVPKTLHDLALTYLFDIFFHWKWFSCEVSEV